MRNSNYRIAFCRVLLASLALALVLPRVADAADQVRFVQRDKATGEYNEGTRSGEVDSFSKDAVAFVYEGKDKEKKTIELPSEQVVWLQFGDEPLALAAARVELQVGNYEEALDKIGEIEEADVKTDLIAYEIEWDRAFATMQQAFADAGKLTSAASMMKKFIENAPEHYRYYEANALLADAAMALNKPADAAKYYAALDNAKSETFKARGKVGLAQVAYANAEYDDAKRLFTEAAQLETLDAQLEGLNVRVIARIGLAKTLAAQKQGKEALTTLETLLAETPNTATRQQATIYNALGEVYAGEDRAQEAIVAYLHVDLLYPAARTERVKALKALAGLWRQVGRNDRAVETIATLRDRFGVELDAE